MQAGHADSVHDRPAADPLQSGLPERPCQRAAPSIRRPARPAITAVHPARTSLRHARMLPAAPRGSWVLWGSWLLVSLRAPPAQGRTHRVGKAAPPGQPGRRARQPARAAHPAVPGDQPAGGRPPARTRCPRPRASARARTEPLAPGKAAPARIAPGRIAPARNGLAGPGLAGPGQGSPGQGGAGSGRPPRAAPAEAPRGLRSGRPTRS